VLCTLTREPKGFPFGSLVAFASDDGGGPLLLLSNGAEHTQNLAAAPAASVLVVDRAAPPGGGPGGASAKAGDALALARATIIGTCARLGDEAMMREAREAFVSVHPETSSYAALKEFAMYRLTPVEARYIGPFGRASDVRLADYSAAEPDPLFDVEAGIIEHMNEDHPDAVLAYARAFGHIDGATRALITSLDRYGFELLAVTDDGEKRARISFAEDVTSTDIARRAFVALVRDARATLTP